MKKIVIVSGEASGDLHGAYLVREMKAIDPDLSFAGVGGEYMRAAGVDILVDSLEMSVVGLTEAIVKIGTIIRVRRLLKAYLHREKPDLVILIDYPEFNLYLARLAKTMGLKVFYYISPQVWAWRKNRVFKIARCVDAMAVIFPFEKQFYDAVSLDIEFVGHPLLDIVKPCLGRDEARKRFGVDDGATTVALLPGSRVNEVRRLLPPMLHAASMIAKRYDNLHFILPLANSLDRAFVQGYVDGTAVTVTIVDDATYDVVAVSDVAVVTSGTATLETALLETPMIIVYIVSPLSYMLGRLFVRIDHIGLANIVAGSSIVPELIQSDATGENIARELAALLDDEQRLGNMRRELHEVKKKLGEPGAAARAARKGYELLSRKD